MNKNQKFNLAKKLLMRFQYNETYQGLNRDGQNFFHDVSNLNCALKELPDFFDILYSKQIPLDSKDNYGNTSMHYAAKNLYQELIIFITNKYGNNKNILDKKNNNGENPFNLATKGNNINAINKEVFNKSIY